MTIGAGSEVRNRKDNAIGRRAGTENRYFPRVQDVLRSHNWSAEPGPAEVQRGAQQEKSCKRLHLPHEGSVGRGKAWGWKRTGALERDLEWGGKGW